MLTVALIAAFLLFGVPAILLLLARLLGGPNRSNRLIGLPIDRRPPKP
jgi:multisubunit Na+/H+ antiporter MnhF subunit